MNDKHDKPTTVKKLREYLAQFPDNMPVVYSCCSQWTALHLKEVSTIEAFDNGGYWSQVFRPIDGLRAKTVLAFPGN